jgi:hypothetical protein
LPPNERLRGFGIGAAAAPPPGGVEVLGRTGGAGQPRRWFDPGSAIVLRRGRRHAGLRAASVLSASADGSHHAHGDVGVRFGGSEHHRIGCLVAFSGHAEASAPVPPWSDGNGKKATAAVMRCGCWRGKVFGGCEPHRGERAHRPVPAAPPGGAVQDVSEGNAMNPRPAAGCNKPATSSVEQTVMAARNREGGPRTAEWQPPRRRELAPGSGHTRGMSVEGRLRTNPKRGGDGASRHQRTIERFEREDKVTRAGVQRLRPTDGGQLGKPSKAQPATAKGQGGARGRPTTRYRTQA